MVLMSSTVLFPHFPMYDFYIASRYRNKDSVLELTQRIRAQGYSVYCFVEPHLPLNTLSG